MRVYVCNNCGYFYENYDYNPKSNSLERREVFENLPKDWTCPVCEAKKEDFRLDNY